MLGVLTAVRKYPNIMREAFVYRDDVLDASTFQCAIDVHVDSWSPQGSNKRIDEERTYSYWLDYLLDLQDDGSDGLKKLLIFITGLDAVPALGFVPEPAVTFRHKTDLDSNDATWEFPVANTCTNTIAIPSTLRSYPIFKDRMNAAVDINVFTTE